MRIHACGMCLSNVNYPTRVLYNRDEFVFPVVYSFVCTHTRPYRRKVARLLVIQNLMEEVRSDCAGVYGRQLYANLQCHAAAVSGTHDFTSNRATPREKYHQRVIPKPNRVPQS